MHKEAHEGRGNMPLINIDGGTVTIEVGYGLTVNKGDFNSERLDVRLTEAFPAQTGPTAAVEAEALQHASTLEAAAKTFVMTALGVDASFDQNGILQPTLGKAAAPAVAAVAPTPISSAPSAPAASPFGNSAPAKTTPQQRDALPTFAADFGFGLQEYTDYRALKANGTYKSTAPDFKPTNDKDGKAIWLMQKNGSIRSDYASILQAAGVAV